MFATQHVQTEHMLILHQPVLIAKLVAALAPIMTLALLAILYFLTK